MREFKKRRTRGAEIFRISAGLLGVLALVAIAFLVCRAAWDMYSKFTEAADARAGAEAQLADLKQRDQVIQADVAALSSDRGVEAAVRERYGVAKPGEGQIDIVRTASSTEPLRQDKSLWQKLWQLLFVW